MGASVSTRNQIHWAAAWCPMTIAHHRSSINTYDGTACYDAALRQQTTAVIIEVNTYCNDRNDFTFSIAAEFPTVCEEILWIRCGS